MTISVHLYAIAMALTALQIGGIACVVSAPFVYLSFNAVIQRQARPYKPFISALIAVVAVLFCALSWHLFAGALVCALAGILMSKKQYRPIMFHGAACAFIAANSYWLHNKKATLFSNHLSQKAHTLDGVITDMQRWARTKNGWVLTIKTLSVENGVSLEHLDLLISCFTYTKPKGRVGDCVRIYRVNIAQQKKLLFLSKLALNEQECLLIFFCPFLSMRILERPHPAYTVRAYIYAYREKVFEQIEATLPPETFAYFSALFLGNRATEQYPKIRRLFNRWGITHYLARSGLHIALLIFLWSLLLLCIPAPLVIKQCALAALIACYSALSWPSISFARAIILWLLYTAALLVRRPAQPLYLLSMISLVVVLLWPANALCLDFQLSFFLTAVLMLMSYKNNTHFISDDLHSQS